jgi:quercetin dioxygenase-like cupin family protein
MATFLALLSATSLGAQVPNPKTLHWGPAPPSLPAGARAARVSGDPSKPGPFTLELDLPDGFVVPPHFHPVDEHQTVISGRIGHGMGDSIDVRKVRWLRPGQSGALPANAHHYAMARGRTIVLVRSTGPFTVTYVNPADDPRKPRP